MAGYEPTVWVDNAPPRLNAAALNKIEQAIAGLSNVTLDPDLTAIGALAGTSGFLKKTGENTWALDTNTYALGTHGHAISDVTGLQTVLDGKQPSGAYLTANQTITLSGDATGSGSTSITVTVADDSHSHTGTTISTLDAGDTTSGTFDIARIPTGVTGTTVALGDHTHAAYLTANQTITLSGDASGSGTTAITVTVADDSHSHTGSTISSLDAGDTTSGTFDINRIPTGTTSSTVSLGNHTHSYVGLTGDETVAGTKTFSGQIAVAETNGIRAGAQHSQTDGVFTAVRDGGSAMIYLAANGTGAYGRIRNWTADGTYASKTAVGADRVLGEFDGLGWGGSNYRTAASLVVATDANPGGYSYNDTSMPGRISFFTSANGSVTPTERLKITATGDISVNGNPTSFGATSRTLQINSATGGYGALLVTSESRTLQVLASTNNGVAAMGTRTSHDLTLCTNDTTRITLASSSGKVTLADVGTTAGIELGSSGPRIAAGSGAPSHAAPIGSKWRNTTTGIDFIKRGTGSTAADWVPTARVTVSSTAPTSPVDGDIWVDTSTEPYRCNSVASTSLSWNSAITPGPYPYLMHATLNANGPGDGYYYYLTNFCYTASSGNLTQMAIPYTGSPGIKYRNRYSGTWTSWYTA